MNARSTIAIVGLAALLLCGCGTPHLSDDPQRITARIVEFGVFHTADSPRGNNAAAGEPELVTQTEHVELGIGVRFGFTFEVRGLPVGEQVTLTQMVRRPEIRYERLTEQNIATTLAPFVAGGKADRGAATYELGRTHEILPGVYAIELWYRGQMLARKVFTVSPGSKPAPTKRGNRVATNIRTAVIPVA